MKSNRNLLAALVVGTALAAGCTHMTDKSVGANIDDATITSKVKAKMAADSKVAAHNIKVDTFQGTVQLSGFANSTAEAMEAERIARDTSGVKSVKNDIRLVQK
jgi:hyperosmotically inducible protein